MKAVFKRGGKGGDVLISSRPIQLSALARVVFECCVISEAVARIVAYAALPFTLRPVSLASRVRS
jgi:hypothetical protein